MSEPTCYWTYDETTERDWEHTALNGKLLLSVHQHSNGLIYAQASLKLGGFTGVYGSGKLPWGVPEAKVWAERRAEFLLKLVRIATDCELKMERIRR